MTPRPAARDGVSRPASFPKNRTEPAAGGMAPVRTLKNVVLPAPLGPIRAVTMPACAVRLMSRLAHEVTEADGHAVVDKASAPPTGGVRRSRAGARRHGGRRCGVGPPGGQAPPGLGARRASAAGPGTLNSAPPRQGPGVERPRTSSNSPPRPSSRPAAGGTSRRPWSDRRVLMGVVEAETDQHQGQAADASAHEVRHLLPHLVVLADADPADADEVGTEHQEGGGADLVPAQPRPAMLTDLSPGARAVSPRYRRREPPRGVLRRRARTAPLPSRSISVMSRSPPSELPMSCRRSKASAVAGGAEGHSGGDDGEDGDVGVRNATTGHGPASPVAPQLSRDWHATGAADSARPRPGRPPNRRDRPEPVEGVNVPPPAGRGCPAMVPAATAIPTGRATSESAPECRCPHRLARPGSSAACRPGAPAPARASARPKMSSNFPSPLGDRARTRKPPVAGRPPGPSPGRGPADRLDGQPLGHGGEDRPGPRRASPMG